MAKSKNEIINKLKELFALTQIKFLDTTLQDGKTIIRTPDATIVAGSAVTLVGADGTESDVADGEYTLQDGTKIVIKSGVVDSITPTAPEAPTSDADMEKVKNPSDHVMDDAKPATPAAADESATSDMITQVLQNICDRLDNIEKSLQANSKSTAAMKSELEAFKKEPGAKPFTSETGGKEIKFGTEEWFEKERSSFSIKKKQTESVKNLEKLLADQKAGKKFEFKAENVSEENMPRSGGSAELSGANFKFGAITDSI